MHFVGIDWADEKHNICIMNAQGQTVSRFVVGHHLDGFQQLVDKLRPFAPVRLAIERIDGLLVDFLAERRYPLYIVTPRTTSARRGRKSKNDDRDAQLLANLLRCEDVECRPLHRSSRLAEQIKHLVRLFDQLQSDQKRANNRLVHALKRYYPALLAMFSHPYNDISLAFLKRYPSPQQARQADLKALTTFFREQRYRYTERIEGFYALLQKPSPEAYDPQGCEYTALALAESLERINSQLKQTKKDIIQLFRQHPDAKLLLSLPGVSELNSVRLLANIGDNRQRFPSVRSLQATAGTVPVTEQSGQQRKVSFRLECSKPLRRTVTDWASSSLRASDWASRYFNQQIARGHSKQRAYRALANSLLRIFWTLWQNNVLYDEALHQSHSHIMPKDGSAKAGQSAPAAEAETSETASAKRTRKGKSAPAAQADVAKAGQTAPAAEAVTAKSASAKHSRKGKVSATEEKSGKEKSEGRKHAPPQAAQAS